MATRWFPYSEFEREGMIARAAGAEPEDNPHTADPDARKAASWLAGWDFRDRAIAAGIPFDD